MESALTMAPPSFSASASAKADLPLAVGPAIRMIAGSLTGLTYSVFARIKTRTRQSLQRSNVTLIKPFRALRPAPGRAAEVLAPPYDVLSSAEARDRAKDKPWSFLHISKPEIDLGAGIDPHDRAVYAKAAENLGRMIAAGIMMRDAKPCYYVY